MLIVDDNAGLRRLLFEAFSDDGYNVEMAANGSEAIRKIQSRIPLAIVMDVRMPKMNGFETLKEIRNITHEIPVILMTAYGEVGIKEEAHSLGAKACIEKPFDLKNIRKLVKDVLAKERGSEKKLIG